MSTCCPTAPSPQRVRQARRRNARSRLSAALRPLCSCPARQEAISEQTWVPLSHRRAHPRSGRKAADKHQLPAPRSSQSPVVVLLSRRIARLWHCQIEFFLPRRQCSSGSKLLVAVSKGTEDLGARWICRSCVMPERCLSAPVPSRLHGAGRALPAEESGSTAVCSAGSDRIREQPAPPGKASFHSRLPIHPEN